MITRSADEDYEAEAMKGIYDDLVERGENPVVQVRTQTTEGSDSFEVVASVDQGVRRIREILERFPTGVRCELQIERDEEMTDPSGAVNPSSSIIPAVVDRQSIVQRLLAFTSERPPSQNEETANGLIASDPFAFVIALLFNEGMKAEKVWAVPAGLRKRLGLEHLDPALLVDFDVVERAVNNPTKLHRYVKKLPKWIVAAASRVLSEYDGNAAKIWANSPTAQEVYLRLDAFLGIGQKKAALGVRILERAAPGSIRDMAGCDVAFDVQVRRVFARTGLVGEGAPDRDHVIAAARELHPTNPSALDQPTWLIGREWCHPTNPNHDGCPLTDVCPKLPWTDKSESRESPVRGVVGAEPPKITEVSLQGTVGKGVRYSRLDARITAPGADLVLAGHDMGPGTPDGDEYEYWLTVRAEFKDSMLLWLIKDRFKDDVDFKQWLGEKAIPSEFANYY